jgi:PPIC-type PPIASE domain/SurA N-terminal domain
MMLRAASGVACALVAGVLFAGCGGSSGSGSPVPVNDVALVDGTPITVTELVTTMNIAKLSMGSSYPEPGTQDWISLRSRALEALAHDAELRTWAHNLGVSVSAGAVDAAVKTTLAGAFPGKTAGTIDEAKVKAEFKRTGMTDELLRHRVETKLLSAAAVKKIGGSPKVTDAQVLAQYNKDKATTYAQPERRKVRHILVKTKALADQLYAQLQSSDASFAALAKQYSTDSSGKSAGGDLGVVTRTSLVKPFADVAFSEPVGVVSKPTKSQFGWHLIEAEGPVLPASTRPLDAALKKQIRSQLVLKAQQTHIADQFDEAVNTLSADIKFAPGYAPALATTQ